MGQTPLAHWLQETLRVMDISQNEFARKSGVASATLTAIRQGGTPQPDTLVRLAKTAGSDMETLLELSGMIRPLPDLPPVTLVTGVGLFLVTKEAQRCSPVTIQRYGWVLRRFVNWASGEGARTCDQITPHLLRLYLAETQRTSSGGTVHDYASVLKTWVRFLCAEDVIPADPFERLADAACAGGPSAVDTCL